MTGGMSPHPLVAHQMALLFLNSFDVASLQCHLRVVGLASARSYELYLETRFVSTKKRKWWNNFLLLYAALLYNSHFKKN